MEGGEGARWGKLEGAWEGEVGMDEVEVVVGVMAEDRKAVTEGVAAEEAETG